MLVAYLLAVVLAVVALSTGLLVVGAITTAEEDEVEYATFAADREDRELDRA
jgi:hypothetical protein